MPTAPAPSDKKEAPPTWKRMGLTTPEELLLWAPHGYLDFSTPHYAFPEANTGKRLFACLVNGHRMFDKDGFPTNSMRQARRLVISVKDHWGNAAEIPVFGNVWDWKDAIQQQELYLYAETDFFNKTLQIRKALTIDPSQLGSIVALYKGIPGRLKAQTVSAAISENLTLLEKAGKLLLQKCRLSVAEFERLTGYPTPHALLLALHAPNSVREGEEALAITRELCVQSIVKAAQANKITRNVPASSIPIQDDVVARLLSALPYTLTKDQQTAIREIVADLRSARPMNRLLAGDVGTGKTLVFLIPLVAAHLAGARVAVMTANQLLVEQALRELAEYFPDVPTFQVKPGTKDLPNAILIGTTSVIGALARAKGMLDFVVTDEQHKFAVSQKQSLMDEHTNLLEATATAIPRTLAVVQFGGMDVSLLRECPVQKDIASRIVLSTEKDRLLDFIKKVAAAGRQTAIVYAAVNAGSEGKSIEDNAAKWQKHFPGQVAIAHGQMPADEKQEALRQMRDKEKLILVSSTVIEVGITLPSLACLIVVNAERFGVAQLHQLRGRVSRHGGRGYFFLYLPQPVTDDDEEDATYGKTAAERTMKRLQLLVDHSNGFDLAEKDAELRGLGDLTSTGSSQHGKTTFLFPNLKVGVHELKKALLIAGLDA